MPGDVGVELLAFLVAEELTAALGAEHEMHDDVGKRLGHGANILGIVNGCWHRRFGNQSKDPIAVQPGCVDRVVT